MGPSTSLTLRAAVRYNDANTFGGKASRRRLVHEASGFGGGDMAEGVSTGEQLRRCQECGASIYQEHLDHHLAGYMSGKLLCVLCMKEVREAARRETDALAEAAGDEPGLALALEEPEGTSDRPSASITGFSMAAGAAPAEDATRYTRALNRSGAGATRCRTFNCKLSDEGARHLDQQINEWIDRNPDVEIKFSTSTVGVWTGKHAEPHLILTLFY